MNTWIDEYYIKGITQNEKDFGHLKVTAHKDEMFSFLSPFEDIRYKNIPFDVKLKLYAAVDYEQHLNNVKAGNTDREVEYVEGILSHFVTPFSGCTRHAIKITCELANDFLWANAPKVTNEDLGFVHGAIHYIDVPNGVLEQQENCFVKAILCVSTSEYTSISVIADTAFPDKDYGVVCWQMGEPFEREECDTTESMRVAVDMQKNIENFIRLSLLYDKTQQSKETVTTLPTVMRPSLTRLSSSKRKARLKHTSLFSFKVLNPPKNCFGRKRNGSRHTNKGSWEVCGHYRLQPCGKGRNDTKLIWIAPFIKGRGILKTKCNVLTAA